jgi:hypothetical protein
MKERDIGVEYVEKKLRISGRENILTHRDALMGSL